MTSPPSSTVTVAWLARFSYSAFVASAGLGCDFIDSVSLIIRRIKRLIEHVVTNETIGDRLLVKEK